jgi:hypothetical protein
MRPKNIPISEKASERANRRTSKIRKSSIFDMAIIAIWTLITVTFALSGLRQDAPIEMKTLMTAGLLFLVFGLVWSVQRVLTKRSKMVDSESTLIDPPVSLQEAND